MLTVHCLVTSVASSIIVKYYLFSYSLQKQQLFLEVILAFSGLQWVIAGQNSYLKLPQHDTGIFHSLLVLNQTRGELTGCRGYKMKCKELPVGRFLWSPY